MIVLVERGLHLQLGPFRSFRRTIQLRDQIRQVHRANQGEMTRLGRQEVLLLVMSCRRWYPSAMNTFMPGVYNNRHTALFHLLDDVGRDAIASGHAGSLRHGWVTCGSVLFLLRQFEVLSLLDGRAGVQGRAFRFEVFASVSDVYVYSPKCVSLAGKNRLLLSM